MRSVESRRRQNARIRTGHFDFFRAIEGRNASRRSDGSHGLHHSKSSIGIYEYVEEMRSNPSNSKEGNDEAVQDDGANDDAKRRRDYRSGNRDLEAWFRYDLTKCDRRSAKGDEAMKKAASKPAKPAKVIKGRDSFSQADKNLFNGVRLRPWTAARAIAGQAMGMLYPEIGAEGREQYKRTKLYPGAIKDTIIALWLCTQTEDRVDEADSMPIEAWRQAREWGAGLKIHTAQRTEFWSAYAIFTKLMFQVDEARTRPKPSEEESEAEEDESGKE